MHSLAEISAGLEIRVFSPESSADCLTPGSGSGDNRAACEAFFELFARQGADQLSFVDRIHRAGSSLIIWLSRRKSREAFLLVAILVIIADRAFAAWIFPTYSQQMESIFGMGAADLSPLEVEFLIGIWLSLIALALGTLLLVISIASQSIPRLIDLYLGNFLSVSFIWFLIGGAFHSLLTVVFRNTPANEPSRIFNMHVLLPAGLLLVFPYTFYVLRQSKPDQVIEQISQQIQRVVRQISSPAGARLLAAPGGVGFYQRQIFESLNQLDDVLSYISFKGPRAAIILSFGSTLKNYLRVKRNIDPSFFQVSADARADISFLTIANQFAVVELDGLLVEQKVLRLLRNAYARMSASSDYDLASLCAKELDQSSYEVLQLSDDPATHRGTNKELLLDLCIVWFNTFMRVAVKDGDRQNDVRNLFNLMYYYGHFASNLAQFDRHEELKKVFRYLRIYGDEMYMRSRRSIALEFGVEVIAAEMSKVLKLVCLRRWPFDRQMELLHVLMSLDRQPGLHDADPQSAIIVGVRLIQVGLALFYMEAGLTDAVRFIIDDLQQDRAALGEERFGKMVGIALNRLRTGTSGFWEDTDRGNENLYYTPHAAHIDEFQRLLAERLN